MFNDKVREAQRAGRLGHCTCWDCLRAAGMTPPYMVRDKYPRLYPRTIFNRRPDDELDGIEIPHGDPEGKPTANRKNQSREDKAVTKAQADERAQLRAAVRNREVI
jgi:hypothetical protein